METGDGKVMVVTLDEKIDDEVRDMHAHASSRARKRKIFHV
jgi:hypothetical protein